MIGWFTLSLLVVFLTGQVKAAPYPEPIKVALAERSPEGFETIAVYVRREILKRETDPQVVICTDGSDDGDLVARQLPEELPTASVDGVIEEYGTRDVVARQLPEEVPSTSVDGVIKEYGTRDVFGRQLPEELATTSVDGTIKEYGTREEDLVARQDIPVELPTTSVDGVIKVYDGSFW